MAKGNGNIAAMLQCRSGSMRHLRCELTQLPTNPLDATIRPSNPYADAADAPTNPQDCLHLTMHLDQNPLKQALETVHEKRCCPQALCEYCGMPSPATTMTLAWPMHSTKFGMHFQPSLESWCHTFLTPHWSGHRSVCLAMRGFQTAPPADNGA